MIAEDGEPQVVGSAGFQVCVCIQPPSTNPSLISAMQAGGLTPRPAPRVWTAAGTGLTTCKPFLHVRHPMLPCRSCTNHSKDTLLRLESAVHLPTVRGRLARVRLNLAPRALVQMGEFEP
jgi:hypothetical protein